MTEVADHPIATPLEPGQPEPGLEPAQPGFIKVLRLRWLVMMGPMALALVGADALLVRAADGPWGVLSFVGIALAVWVVMATPSRQFARLGHALDSDSLRVVRGYLFHTDTIVPFVRVQHIDVGAGPIERLCGVAHVVVHTAGTHNSIVTLPGLDPDAASAMREAIRRHIVTDFA